MKKAFLILGLVAVSAAAGGLTAWTVSADRGGSVAYIEREVERTPALGTQFTSYQAEQYPDLTYAAENAVKAVVNIEAIQQVEMPQRRGYDPFLEFFGIPQDYGRGDGGPQYREQRAGGSGVIISEDGYIVTNNHVVDGASKLKVKLNDGRSFDAKLIGKDSATDLALLKVEAKGLPTLAFGSSDALRLGEWVLAIGSPFDLQSTITAGIVSAKARQLGAIPNDFRIESFIQTDAAVNPGNSGGALLDVGQGADQLREEVEPHAADVEILHRAHGLHAEIILRRDFHFAQQIVFTTGFARKSDFRKVHDRYVFIKGTQKRGGVQAESGAVR